MDFLNLITVSLFLLTIDLCLSSVEETVENQYKGYKVLRLLPNTVDQLHYLSDLSTDIQFVIPNKKIDFWTQPKDLNSSVDVMVSPEVYKNIRQKFSQQNIKNKVIIQDVGEYAFISFYIRYVVF
jgi:hypothetical protein